jgi:hypothetical protein
VKASRYKERLEQSLHRVALKTMRALRKPLTDKDRGLMVALAGCTGEVLSAEDFVWHAEDDVINVSGIGEMVGSGIIVVLPGSPRVCVYLVD